MACGWYYDSDNSNKEGSSNEAEPSDTDLTEPEDGFASEVDQTDSGAEDSDSTMANSSNTEESGTLSHQVLSIKKLAISKNQRYEGPGDNPTQNLSDIDPDFNMSGNTKKLRSRVIDRWHCESQREVSPLELEQTGGRTPKGICGLAISLSTLVL
ncbi:hypothetical protein TSTA_075060 [Talaromyces stipitatus ATCC 10500]|uniref:Uncharacterized protein n=1 Tax=Talaromyces stipitatus (strain ATCC 10500 / CBS 375.48 / QM 6759 / NRRL 1006) TaxID=441959 RepID=B8LWA2_TALSN|nr:uncharacterized protein TSTA_075060 [Talaromyces stipitatus ATCC 10500]EED24130.1 hypothetical protein TSTA_075060 [Talaromyces stipitatus ATCC 10500]